jgi:GT2 family glycosyltransferase
MKISVIIATHGRHEELKGALRSVLTQETGGSFDYEVIVVENNPFPQLKPLIEAYGAQVRYVHQPLKGKSNAINRGIEEAAGDIVAFTDDDVLADPRWLAGIMECFQTYRCDGVGGRVLPVYPEGTAQWIKDNAVQLAGAVVIYDYDNETRPLEASMFPFIGANAAYLRQVFKDCGYLRVDLGPGTPVVTGEDTEFVQRLMARGKKLMYCGQAIVRHPFDPKRLNLKRMAAWHICLGKFDAQRERQEGGEFVYCFGVPRYLFRGIIGDFFNLPMNYGNRIKFLNAWRAFFRKAGMIQEYVKMGRKEIMAHG